MNIQEIASASAQIKEILTPLAEKIGQSGEYVFDLFVKQAYVNALISLLWWAVGGFFLWISAKKIPERAKENENAWPLELFTIPITFLAILLPLAGLIQVLVNPQFQAIKLILETLKAQY